MRLIDADELKLGIISQSNAGRESYSTELICDFIDDQPAVGEWIPADQPPDDDHYVLLSFSNFSVPQIGRYDRDGFGGAYYVGYDYESCISNDLYVNAWMELPVSYMSVENELHRDNTMQIKIKYHTDITPLERIAGSKSDWIDLRAAEDVLIPVGEYKLISLGVSMELPAGYEAHIVPRSSTFKNYGIIQVNSIGIIDNAYCGDNDIWHFPAFCLVGKDVVNGAAGTMIHKNDRICQFRIVKKQPEISFLQVDRLGNEDRDGIGSTGRR